MNELESILLLLIEILSEKRIIDKDFIIDTLCSDRMLVLSPSKRYNYTEIAKELEYLPVFIPIDRKRALYARKVFEKVLGKPVTKRRYRIGDLTGYLFTLEQPQEQ